LLIIEKQKSSIYRYGGYDRLFTRRFYEKIMIIIKDMISQEEIPVGSPGPEEVVRPRRSALYRWSPWLVYAGAVVLTVATLIIYIILIEEFYERPLLILFMLPIILSAYVGGLGPGLVSTFLAALFAVYFLIPPFNSVVIEKMANLAQLIVLILMGVFVSLLSEALHRSYDDMEQRVAKRTADLQRTVEQLQEEMLKRQRAQEALRESEERLRHLSFQLLTSQETERKRIAVELHDGLGQALIVSKMRLWAIECSLSESEPKKECGNLLAYIDEVIENVRRLSYDLMPLALQDLGLHAALLNLLDEFAKYNGIRLSTNLDDIQALFSPEKQLIIYRIFQESLNNITKHAQATEVSVALKRESEGLYFLLEDNGKGFDIQKVLASDSPNRGLGLAALEERVQMMGGSLQMWSQMGSGTRLSFFIPS
jgi:signal transduction histidine kinase